MKTHSLLYYIKKNLFIMNNFFFFFFAQPHKFSPECIFATIVQEVDSEGSFPFGFQTSSLIKLDLRRLSCTLKSNLFFILLLLLSPWIHSPFIFLYFFQTIVVMLPWEIKFFIKSLEFEIKYFFFSFS